MRGIVTVILAALLLAAGNAGAAERTKAPAAVSTAATAEDSPKLDLNRASREELLGIPGIGPRMAQDIVDLRTRKGFFTRIEELLEVRGIKQKKLARISHLLTIVQQPPTATTAPTSQTR